MKDPLLSHLEGGTWRADDVDYVDLACRQPHLLDRLVSYLDLPDSHVRARAANLLSEIAGQSPELLAPHVAALAAGLEHEEVPTRVGLYRALAAVAESRPEALGDEFDAIRLGLFDPGNPEIRSCAALAVARFGSVDAVAARRAFPHLAEALRRFHDAEGALELIRSFAVLARASNDEGLRKDIWRAVRRHEKHPDPAVRNSIDDIALLVR